MKRFGFVSVKEELIACTLKEDLVQDLLYKEDLYEESNFGCSGVTRNTLNPTCNLLNKSEYFFHQRGITHSQNKTSFINLNILQLNHKTFNNTFTWSHKIELLKLNIILITTQQLEK